MIKKSFVKELVLLSFVKFHPAKPVPPVATKISGKYLFNFVLTKGIVFRIDKFFLMAFPILFFSFNIIYWLMLLTA